MATVYIKAKVIALACITSIFYAGLSSANVVPHDEAYFTSNVRNTQLIYSESNLPFAKQAAGIELLLQPLYEDVFGYQMDEILYVGLASPYNQIANGFSTPFPNNRQINYIGGALAVDYFSSPSWLKILLYHETAHNYQINAKQSVVSRTLHTVFGNGIVILPWATIPNMLESSFMLEGNAVLNESWHGNGGRLYSGRFKAATLMQARAGYLRPELVYNDNYNFLYGSHFYTLGGYYQYFLAQNYGLKKTNKYWKEHSYDWYYPFFTNRSTWYAVGVDFNTTFRAWRRQMEAEAEKVVDVEGDAIATSQFYTPINADADEIYFIINETGRSFPALVIYDKASGKLTKSRQSYIAGKVIKLADGRYVTQAGANTSPWRIKQGLYDDGAFIVDGTDSRIIEGYLQDGTPVYFDVPGSYDQPQLYVGDAFYAQVNSSVLIDDDDNLYYFVQGDEKERTLYKNKQALLDIRGYYSYVSGVDSQGAVYFIANTEHGSGLFRYHNGAVTRAHPADTIFDARLIDDSTALVAVMGSDAYSYKRIGLSEIDEAPHEVKLFVEDEPYYRKADPDLHHVEIPEIDTSDRYSSLFDMHYSGTNIALGSDEDAGLLFSINLNFADPLFRNSFSAFVLRNADEYTLGGVGYANAQYFLQYSIAAYDILDRPDTSVAVTDERDNGLIVNASLPFLKKGYYSGTLRGGYFQDYESNSRKPLSLALDLSRAEQYGVSMYQNALWYALPYVATDRDDRTTGGEMAFSHSLFGELYLNLRGQTSSSDANTSLNERGVKLVKNQAEKIADSDPTTIVMPGQKGTFYAKEVTKGSLGFTKVFNASAYSFRYPISLRREAVYLDYNTYDIELFTPAAQNEKVNEVVLGMTLDTYILHRVPVPVSFEYIHNDNDTLGDSHTFAFRVGLSF